MQTLVFVNPLKPGKLKEYRAFCAQNTGPRKREYLDLMKRYGIKNAKVYYHRVGEKEIVVVVHDAEDDALERLKGFASSTNPYDRWFVEQLQKMHDFSDGDNQTEHLFSFP